MFAPLLLASALALAPAHASSVAPTNTPYVIVTTAALRDSFAPLADWHTRTGMPAAVVALEDILAGSTPGRDAAERLRNWLRGTHDSYGVRWVLLGGDGSVVPVRMASLDPGIPGLTQQTFATDDYFACLGGDWDANGNGVFGEPADAPDLAPWLAVGRAPVRTPEEAGRFVRKTLAYSRAPNAHYLPIDLVACASFGAFPPSFGRTFSVVITTADPLARVQALLQPVASTPWDTLQPGESLLTLASAMAALGAGPHVAVVDAPTDTGAIQLSPYTVYPAGIAHPSDFRVLANGARVTHLLMFGGMSLFGPDGLGDAAVLAENGGAVSAAGATATNLISPSSFFQRAYLAFLAGGTWTHVGEAFLHARDTLRVMGPTQPTILLQHESLALLGDPALPFWRKAPLPFAASAVRLGAGATDSVRVHASVAGACVVVTGDGAWLGQAVTGADGGASIAIPAAPGTVLVTLSGDGLAPVELALAAPAGVGTSGTAGGALAFAPPTPNPARSGASFAWRAAGDSQLDLFDAAGRRVRSWRVAGAGQHTLPWDLRDDAGRAVAAGLYLARVASGADEATRRVLVLP